MPKTSVCSSFPFSLLLSPELIGFARWLIHQNRPNYILASWKGRFCLAPPKCTHGASNRKKRFFALCKWNEEIKMYRVGHGKDYEISLPNIELGEKIVSLHLCSFGVKVSDRWAGCQKKPKSWNRLATKHIPGKGRERAEWFRTSRECPRFNYQTWLVDVNLDAALPVQFPP